MLQKTFFLVRLVWPVLTFLGICGCVTTTEIDEGYGVTVEEEPALVDQVKVDD